MRGNLPGTEPLVPPHLNPLPEGERKLISDLCIMTSYSILRGKDSNLDKGIQIPLCCRYTTPECKNSKQQIPNPKKRMAMAIFVIWCLRFGILLLATIYASATAFFSLSS